ncbi:P-loop containing nucleoside triphosphate hydrolase protein [Rhizodiscina lignyota]|uniref:P-loop containing nucleoside triphosphate hydrolase protein n=1 Tax=Rhizodiscina lignyota TaxID=1504668 RepID=A0A9P4I3I0_9PEZI|nr:P-loop containing nucleoside triphosphate hydrolase protein [Rhizodiscina lignyota]
MDFRRLDRMLRQSSVNPDANSTASLNLTDLSPNILEAFIPGYSLISRFILQIFGFDIGIVVTTGLLCFAVISGGKYFWNTIYKSLNDVWMSHVTIDGKDDLFRHVLAWVSEHRMTKESRRLIAVSQNTSPQEDEAAEEYISEDGLFHFGKWAAKKPPRYEPAVGTHWFWHNRNLFIFQRIQKETRNTPYQNIEEHRLTIKCIGRSTNPLKDWIEHVKIWAVEKQTTLTTIKRPTAKDQRRPPGHWSVVTQRPSRPLETVVLDPEQKARLVADVNEYLHPASPKWYATRGIPYRRGYLFHGPPGTGKSSLSFALAGLFGLDIHVVSLNESGLSAITESELMLLFNNLPRRCIVLLEDIDTAGLSRDHLSDQRRNEKPSDPARQGISLSGLLNAIDGVASHEGRVLVMTTNHPEELDNALIRPGRVDMQIKFTLATRHQAHEIFTRIDEAKVANEEPDRSLEEKGGHDAGAADGNLSNGHVTPPTTPKVPSVFEYLTTEPEPPLSKEELEDLANEFADRVPEETFSPAELQSFLIIRKKRPRQALQEVDQWREDFIRVRNEGSKVLEAQ